MINLMRLEVRKNKIRTFIIASILISIAMLGFIYLFAYAPHIEPNDPDLMIFAGYRNIVALYGVVCMTAFSILASVMYSRFMIDEYTGKRLILTFSYPINRKKIVIVKLLVVSLFTIVSMVLCNLIVFTIFGVTELIHPLVEETLTLEYLFQALMTTVTMAILATSISIIAAGIGFIKKSIPTTMISAIILSSLFCNIVASSVSVTFVLVSVMIVVIIGAVVAVLLMNKIEHMEVE